MYQKMQVQGTDLTVQVEKGLPFVGLDKLVVINNSGGVIQKITSWCKEKRIEGIYPLTFCNGEPVVGNKGVIKIDSNDGNNPKSVCYNVLTQKQVDSKELYK